MACQGDLSPTLPVTLMLSSPAATERLAEAIAPHLKAGDFVALSGDLGAGKSVLARALIAKRLAALGRSEAIPSPTYTLVQVYDVGGLELWHADLYRLGDPSELAELGLTEALEEAIAVVEWADRLGPDMPARVLAIDLASTTGHEDLRVMKIEARGAGWDWLPAVLEETAR